MTYYINVSLNGKHFFRTDEYSYFEIKEVYKALRIRFTKNDGYEVIANKVIKYTKSSEDLEKLSEEGF